MPVLSLERIKDYRSQTYHTKPEYKLRSVEDAIEFVNQRGFVFFWPVKGMELPSLWAAVAGNRPVADEHDDPGHVTWGWKDELLGKRRWYYGRVLRRRNTIISMSTIPYFYALSPNYGDPEADYLDQYDQGLLTAEAKSVYEALLREGPLDTLSLRRAAHLSSSANDSRFNKAADDLQKELKILPVGISEAGAWHYAFILDIVARHLPELPEQARPILESSARKKLIGLFFQSVGVASNADIAKLFGWRHEDYQKQVSALVESGDLIDCVEIKDQPGDYLCARTLI
jgi:hypothetical protein